MKLCGLQPLTEYLRSPSSPFVDNTAIPTFLPIVPDRKLRTECGCQPVAFINSFAVAPPGRLSRSKTLGGLAALAGACGRLRQSSAFGCFRALPGGGGLFPASPWRARHGGSVRQCWPSWAVLLKQELYLLFRRFRYSSYVVLLSRLLPRSRHSSFRRENEGKAIRQDSGENLSRVRKRALESPGWA